MDTVECPSPNFDARPKDSPVDILLFHYTGMESGAAAVARLCDANARVSAHYTVDEDGTIFSHVTEECRAWHAGVSYWAGATDVNARSIGIEVVNPGHEFGYRSFPDAQVEALIILGRDILRRRAIPPERVLGHSDVAPARKMDPGELFPWAMLAEAGIGLWPGTPPTRSASRSDLPAQGEVKKEAPRHFFQRGEGIGKGDFEAGLRRFGYGFRPDTDVSLDVAIAAFQRHFRPSRIDGVADEECKSILAALLNQFDKP